MFHETPEVLWEPTSWSKQQLPKGFRAAFPLAKKDGNRHLGRGSQKWSGLSEVLKHHQATSNTLPGPSTYSSFPNFACRSPSGSQAKQLLRALQPPLDEPAAPCLGGVTPNLPALGPGGAFLSWVYQTPENTAQTSSAFLTLTVPESFTGLHN